MSASKRRLVTDHAPVVCDPAPQPQQYRDIEYRPDGAIKYVVLALVILFATLIMSWVVYKGVTDPYIAPLQ